MPQGVEEQQCPICHHDEVPIVESRGTRRRRECGACHHRYTTYEVTAERLAQLEAIEQHAGALAEIMSKETG